MRDRLVELGGVATKDHKEEDQVDSGEDVDSGEFEQHAVVFEGEDIMEDAFREAQSIQKEIAQLRMEVKRLGKQNTRFLTSVRRISSIKRDSNTIARNIKTKGENLYARIQKMDALCKELEEKNGAHSALVRMIRGQFVSITGFFSRGHEWVQQRWNGTEGQLQDSHPKASGDHG